MTYGAGQNTYLGKRSVFSRWPLRLAGKLTLFTLVLAAVFMSGQPTEAQSTTTQKSSRIWMWGEPVAISATTSPVLRAQSS